MSAAYTCPAGHASTTGDYCDTCGAAIVPPTGGTSEPAVPAASASASAATAPPGGSAAGLRCSNCGADRVPDDAFCEVCGLDFSTGLLPAPPPAPEPAPAAPDPEAEAEGTPVAPAATGWTAVVEADREWFATNRAEGGVTLTFPEEQAPREVPLAGDEVQVGRGGASAIDLDRIDRAVSHRHLRLVRHGDGAGWDVIDDGSANGTWLDDGPDPIPRGEAVSVGAGSRIHIGAFTTITLRDDRPAQAPAQP